MIWITKDETFATNLRREGYGGAIEHLVAGREGRIDLVIWDISDGR
jgi:hypothetical protein